MGDDDNSGSDAENFKTEAQTLQTIIGAMESLSGDARERLLRTLATFFGTSIDSANTARRVQQFTVEPSETMAMPSFSEDRSMSPKEFLLEKQPRSDVERVACLAFYLTHYRDTQHFKTIDISKLNTEAAQRKFSNAAKAVDNATRSEYLVPSTKGQKQLGAVGEVFVQNLPDRDAARDSLAKLRPRKRRVSKKPASTKAG